VEQAVQVLRKTAFALPLPCPPWMVYGGNHLCLLNNLSFVCIVEIKVIKSGFGCHLRGRFYQHIRGDSCGFVISDILWIYLFNDRIDIYPFYVRTCLWRLRYPEDSRSKKDQLQRAGFSSTPSGDLHILSSGDDLGFCRNLPFRYRDNDLLAFAYNHFGAVGRDGVYLSEPSFLEKENDFKSRDWLFYRSIGCKFKLNFSFRHPDSSFRNSHHSHYDSVDKHSLLLFSFNPRQITVKLTFPKALKKSFAYARPAVGGTHIHTNLRGWSCLRQIPPQAGESPVYGSKSVDFS